MATLTEVEVLATAAPPPPVESGGRHREAILALAVAVAVMGLLLVAGDHRDPDEAEDVAEATTTSVPAPAGPLDDLFAGATRIQLEASPLDASRHRLATVVLQTADGFVTIDPAAGTLDRVVLEIAPLLVVGAEESTVFVWSSDGSLAVVDFRGRTQRVLSRDVGWAAPSVRQGRIWLRSTTIPNQRSELTPLGVSAQIISTSAEAGEDGNSTGQQGLDVAQSMMGASLRFDALQGWIQPTSVVRFAPTPDQPDPAATVYWVDGGELQVTTGGVTFTIELPAELGGLTPYGVDEPIWSLVAVSL